MQVWDIASATEILFYDAGTHIHNIEFSPDSTKIVMNDKMLSILSQIPSRGTMPESFGPDPDLSISRMAIKGD
jgi:hypothetical protein